eukprot:TRINITY_DN21846_c0_g1_i1.p1 TRINITY_DN21846_c0_g1~~TRINITY_DN21846_c0_g1_i1.p1  ORF type:complete len:408 (-),score=19.29 TRINITY_DN21846_c0_g1_i1:46-1269(-)
MAECTLCGNPVGIVFPIFQCDCVQCICCCLARWILQKNHTCSVCKKSSPTLILSTKLQSYRRFTLSMLKHDPTRNIHLEKDRNIAEALDVLCAYACPLCESPFTSRDELAAHVECEHNKSLCPICTQSNLQLPYQWRLYPTDELEKHKSVGYYEGEVGHPICAICNEMFDSFDDMLQHGNDDHHVCLWCPNTDKCTRLWETREGLSDHVSQKHFVCKEDDCGSSDKLVVFRDEIGYKTHVLREHKNKLTKNQRKKFSQIEPATQNGPQPNLNGQRSGNTVVWNDNHVQHFDEGGALKPAMMTPNSPLQKVASKASPNHQGKAINKWVIEQAQQHLGKNMNQFKHLCASFTANKCTAPEFFKGYLQLMGDTDASRDILCHMVDCLQNDGQKITMLMLLCQHVDSNETQ